MTTAMIRVLLVSWCLIACFIYWLFRSFMLTIDLSNLFSHSDNIFQTKAILAGKWNLVTLSSKMPQTIGGTMATHGPRWTSWTALKRLLTVMGIATKSADMSRIITMDLERKITAEKKRVWNSRRNVISLPFFPRIGTVRQGLWPPSYFQGYKSFILHNCWCISCVNFFMIMHKREGVFFCSILHLEWIH